MEFTAPYASGDDVVAYSRVVDPDSGFETVGTVTDLPAALP
jgi:hypothetical protein